MVPSWTLAFLMADKADIRSGSNVSSYLRLCLSLSVSVSPSHATAVGQDLKWVTGLCLIDPHTATVVIFLSPGPLMRS